MFKITVALLVLLLVASCVFVLPVKAQSRTFIVPDKYSTIQAAINNASDGDRIFVRAGTYRENLVVDKALSLVGEAADITIVAGDGNVGFLVRHDNVELTGFKIIMSNTAWYWYGVHLLSVKNCSIYNNKIENAYYGIWLYDASSNRIFDNKISGNYNGIQIEASLNNIIVSNTISGNNQFGICIAHSSNNTIAGNYLSSNSEGIQLNTYSVNSYSGPPSQNNLIIGNSVTQNVYSGIWLSGAFCNSIIGNRITGNGLKENVGDGILIEASSQNLIKDNILSMNRIGIRLEASCNNITRNQIENNRFSGIANYYKFPAPFENKIFSNNIINNNVSFSNVASNMWDDNSRGNFWSAYEGEDLDGNGIGDTPYVINSGFIDHFPLMSPVTVELPTVDWSSLLTVPMTGVFPALDLTAPKLVLLSLNNQTLLYGNFSLTFTVNESPSWVGYSLDSQDNVTISGNLTLTELPIGNHNITVYATDEAGNTGFSETLHFSIDAPVASPEPFAVVPVAAVLVASIVFGSVAFAVLSTTKRRKRTFGGGVGLNLSRIISEPRINFDFRGTV